MDMQCFELDRLPDLTMAKYSIQENSGIDDVLRQHSSFYRQLHHRGLLFGEVYTLLYLYDPSRPAGKKIRLLFFTERKEKIALLDRFLDSTALSPLFPMKPETVLPNTRFRYCASVHKKSATIGGTPSGQSGYYLVDPWKCSEKGRLMGLFRLMKALDRPCAYSVRMYPTEQAETFRKSLQGQMKFMQPENGSGMFGHRDDLTSKVERLYQDTIDELRNNPHFYCDVCAFADDAAMAQMLVDAAAAEAVEEGSYTVTVFSGAQGYAPASPAWNGLRREENAPAGTEYWGSLFLLKELVPFSVFPTLYAGETIELPKESAPNYEREGLCLGKDAQGYDVFVPLALLPKHALVAGVPGSGKTYTMLNLISQLSGKQSGIPVMVLEPAKQEYRALAKNPEIGDLTVFSPGGSGLFPLRINPFEFPFGMKVSEQIVNLRQVFIGAFDLEPPMPFLLDQAIENVYRACGWYPFDRNIPDENGNPRKPYPNMAMLYAEAEKLLESPAFEYGEEVRGNLKTVLQVRIGSLISRETGNVFNVPGSTFHPEEWMEHSCVLELESLGKDAASFLTLLLSTIIRELLKLHPQSERSPRHVILFEEAHNLIGPVTEPGGAAGNAKVASTKFIVDMLAEVRALKESIIIADQLPTALASQVTKNTSLKIGLRITSQDDREMLGSTMSADPVQLEQMGLFQPGHALCLYEGVQKPFEVQIGKYPFDVESPDDEELYLLQKDRTTYAECMRRDYAIMEEKYRNRMMKALEDWLDCDHTDDIVSEETQKLFAIKDSEKRETMRRTVSAYKKKNTAKKTEILETCRELVLEFGDYVCANRIMLTHALPVLKQEITDLKQIASQKECAHPELNVPYPNGMDEQLEQLWRRATTQAGVCIPDGERENT